jgi:carbonic anhydrase
VAELKLPGGPPDSAGGTSPSPRVSPDEALHRLIEGNDRFVRGASHIPGLLRETLADLAHGQQPYATVLGCSDSRVPPELVFDAWLGDLFVVRLAGNVLSTRVAGSLQYAGAHLRTPLFVVLGHEGCGAITAALKTRDEGASQYSHIQLLVDSILPALPPFDPRLSFEERVAQAVESNVRWTVARILESSERDEAGVRVAGTEMKVVGAIYEIKTGRVRFLD